MVTELINNGMITDAIAQLKDRALKYPNENFIDRIEAIATDFKACRTNIVGNCILPCSRNSTT